MSRAFTRCTNMICECACCQCNAIESVIILMDCWVCVCLCVWRKHFQLKSGFLHQYNRMLSLCLYMCWSIASVSVFVFRFHIFIHAHFQWYRFLWSNEFNGAVKRAFRRWKEEKKKKKNVLCICAFSNQNHRWHLCLVRFYHVW